eukprot:12120183-Alexandrium_andersonii.AAC.1
MCIRDRPYAFSLRRAVPPLLVPRPLPLQRGRGVQARLFAFPVLAERGGRGGQSWSASAGRAPARAFVPSRRGDGTQSQTFKVELLCQADRSRSEYPVVGGFGTVQDGRREVVQERHGGIT